MRRRTFLTLGTEGIKGSEADACDICLFNKRTKKLLIVEAYEFSVSEYPSTNYSPIGVVVIPGYHNVYGDNSCAVISLKYMNYSTPDTGSTSYQNMCWGQDDVDISDMTNYSKVCHVGYKGSISNITQGITGEAYLPSDKFSTFQNPYDTDTYYYWDTDYSLIPSPYDNYDGRNPAYYQTSDPSSTTNAMSDFDGVGNTTKLTNLATAQSDWKTASTITDKHYNSYYPAACCCWRYHTDGTKQGDWYLPACGELGYIVAKYNKIQQSFSKLISAYGSTVVAQLGDSNSYWSSTEFSSYGARTVSASDGKVRLDGKNYGSCVRAFLRVK